jgi:hypothetical protein
MAQHRGQGAVQKGAGAANPPTGDELQQRQAAEFSGQAPAAMRHGSLTAEERAAIEAGGEPVDDPDEILIEGPNSA